MKKIWKTNDNSRIYYEKGDYDFSRAYDLAAEIKDELRRRAGGMI